MRKWSKRAAILLGVTALAAGATEPSATQPAPTRRPPAVTAPHLSRTQYEVVIRYNIFMRGGNPGSNGWNDTARVETRPRRSLEVEGSRFGPGTWALRGTVLQAGERVAFLENMRSGDIKTAHVGDVVGGRRLTEIDSGGIRIDGGDAPQSVAVGQQLDGSAATTMPAVAESEGDSDAGPTTAPGDRKTTVGSAADMLERLRARRRQELSK